MAQGTNNLNVEGTIASLEQTMAQYAALNDANAQFSAFMTTEATELQSVLSADTIRRDGSRQTTSSAGQMAKDVKNMSNELTRG